MEFKLTESGLYSVKQDGWIIGQIKYSPKQKAWLFNTIMGNELDYAQVAQLLNFMGTLTY